jgi:hypothetical protein
MVVMVLSATAATLAWRIGLKLGEILLRAAQITRLNRLDQ